MLGLLLLLVTIISTPTKAQELIDDEEGVEQNEVLRNKPVECYTAQSTIEQADKNGYEIFWQGSNIKDNFPDNTIAILVRSDTNAWIALEMNMEAACILGYGGNFWLFDQYYSKLDPIDMSDKEAE